MGILLAPTPCFFKMVYLWIHLYHPRWPYEPAGKFRSKMPELTEEQIKYILNNQDTVTIKIVKIGDA